MARRDAKRTLRRTLISRPRILLLDQLQRGGPQTAPQLAAGLRLHHNTVREHLERLVDDGLVVRETEHRTVRGRPRILFAAAGGQDGLSSAAQEQTERAIALGRAYRLAYHDGADDEPQDEQGCQDAGPQAATTAAEQFDVLEDYLDRCGFRPRIDRPALAVRLSCPFGELRDSLDAVICDVDRRAMCSVLARVDGPLRVATLARTGPPAEATCILQLSPAPLDAATSCPECPPDPRTSSAD